MLEVFIDTNVYLTFFSFTEEDLEELRKLRVAIENREVRLWTTRHVKDELQRNREARVAQSLDAIRKLKPGGKVPQMARNLADFGAFIAARRQFEQQLNALDEQLPAEFFDGTPAADRVLKELLGVATEIVMTEDVVEAARRRAELGRPRGKPGSLGDAINWECLLAKCPSGHDLHLVTEDLDFASKVNRERVSTYLNDEWRRLKGSQIVLHSRISSFFKARFPAIELASEFEKELRIRALVSSNSFESTHRAVAGLAGYTDYTPQQVRYLVEGALSTRRSRRSPGTVMSETSCSASPRRVATSSMRTI
jgi:predicted nucleic acid-binding protein